MKKKEKEKNVSSVFEDDIVLSNPSRSRLCDEVCEICISYINQGVPAIDLGESFFLYAFDLLMKLYKRGKIEIEGKKYKGGKQRKEQRKKKYKETKR